MIGFGGASFNPDRDIPDLSGKVILVTGGNSGLGAATIKALAKHNPSELWLAARTRSTADDVVATVKESTPTANIIHLDLDLSSFASIRRAAATFLSRARRLDVLFLNAGVALTAPSLTADGYEGQFGVNHMGHALLTKLLLPLMLETAADRVPCNITTSPRSSRPAAKDVKVNDVRIIITSSAAHYAAPLGMVNYNALRGPCTHQSSVARYGTSKLANLLFGIELARRYPTITTVPLHPGVVQTGLLRGYSATHPVLSKSLLPLVNLFSTDVDKGVQNQLWAATATKGVTSGTYYDPVGKKGGMSALAKTPKAAKALWDWTEDELFVEGEEWPSCL